MFLAFIIIIGVVAFMWYYIKNTIEGEKRMRGEYGKELLPYAYCKNEFLGSVLELKKRSSQLEGAFKIEENRNVNVSYTPDKLIYTGATVGGITTGGFHVEKGGYSLHSGSKTGTYRLVYKYGDNCGSDYETTVDSIKMYKKDYEYAKKTFSCLHSIEDKPNVLKVNGRKESLEELVQWMCNDN